MTPVEGSWAGVVRQLVLVVPLLTVLPEELAFRGVPGRCCVARPGPGWRRWSRRRCSGSGTSRRRWAGGRPTTPRPERSATARPGSPPASSGTVLVTFLAGLLFCALRAGSGSLLAPIGLHWTVNSAGIVLVHLV